MPSSLGTATAGVAALTLALGAVSGIGERPLTQLAYAKLPLIFEANRGQSDPAGEVPFPRQGIHPLEEVTA